MSLGSFLPSKTNAAFPLMVAFVVIRTNDGGQTFETLSDGLPQSQAYDLVFRHCLEVDETGECLAMGSSTGSLWISEDGGSSDGSNCLRICPQIYCLRFT